MFIPKIKLERSSIRGCITFGNNSFTIDDGTISEEDISKISRIQATKSVRPKDQLIKLNCEVDDYELEEVWNASYCCDMNLDCTILEGNIEYAGCVELHGIMPKNLSQGNTTTLYFYLSKDAGNTKIVKLE